MNEIKKYFSEKNTFFCWILLYFVRLALNIYRVLYLLFPCLKCLFHQNMNLPSMMPLQFYHCQQRPVNVHDLQYTSPCLLHLFGIRETRGKALVWFFKNKNWKCYYCLRKCIMQRVQWSAGSCRKMHLTTIKCIYKYIYIVFENNDSLLYIHVHIGNI